jgi:hypothetical protein
LEVLKRGAMLGCRSSRRLHLVPGATWQECNRLIP